MLILLMNIMRGDGHSMCLPTFSQMCILSMHTHPAGRVCHIGGETVNCTVDLQLQPMWCALGSLSLGLHLMLKDTGAVVRAFSQVCSKVE